MDDLEKEEGLKDPSTETDEEALEEEIEGLDDDEEEEEAKDNN